MMTHTLHREGSIESLKNDFVFVITGAKGFNKKGCAPRVREMLRIVSTFNPINMGSMEVGNLGRGMPPKEIINNITDAGIVQAAFDDKETVIKVLKALKDADLGISVTISGLTEEVKDIMEKAGVGDEVEVDVSIDQLYFFHGEDGRLAAAPGSAGQRPSGSSI